MNTVDRMAESDRPHARRRFEPIDRRPAVRSARYDVVARRCCSGLVRDIADDGRPTFDCCVCILSLKDLSKFRAIYDHMRPRMKPGGRTVGVWVNAEGSRVDDANFSTTNVFLMITYRVRRIAPGELTLRLFHRLMPHFPPSGAVAVVPVAAGFAVCAVLARIATAVEKSTTVAAETWASRHRIHAAFSSKSSAEYVAHASRRRIHASATSSNSIVARIAGWGQDGGPSLALLHRQTTRC